MTTSRNGFIDFRAVKAQVTIVQVLEHYGLTDQMRPLGQDSLTGCCPLHQGQNPTQFRVSIPKNCWHCFSECQCGGNVLDFIARMEKVSIYEAARLASRWFSLVLENTGNSGPAGRESVPRSKQHARPAPQALSNDVSPVETEAGRIEAEPNMPLSFQLSHLEPEHPYLSNRGLTPETVAEFGLGYCKKGLLAGRIAIPIHNGNGELVAYAGRSPGEPSKDKPKYQFPKGFRKGLELYNHHRAKNAPSTSPLIVVEGFFDCIRVWQAGFARVVALMGCSISESQEDQLMALVGSQGQLALMLDGDDAGRSATSAVLPRLISQTYVRLIQLDKSGKQPDELSSEQLHNLLVREEVAQYGAGEALFPLGQLVATPAALAAIEQSDLQAGLGRHMRGDWGELDPEDKLENDRSLQNGWRLLSAYYGANGTKFWIITEADEASQPYSFQRITDCEIPLFTGQYKAAVHAPGENSNQRQPADNRWTADKRIAWNSLNSSSQKNPSHRGSHNSGKSSRFRSARLRNVCRPAITRRKPPTIGASTSKDTSPLIQSANSSSS